MPPANQIVAAEDLVAVQSRHTPQTPNKGSNYTCHSNRCQVTVTHPIQVTTRWSPRTPYDKNHYTTPECGSSHAGELGKLALISNKRTQKNDDRLQPQCHPNRHAIPIRDRDNSKIFCGHASKLRFFRIQLQPKPAFMACLSFEKTLIPNPPPVNATPCLQPLGRVDCNCDALLACAAAIDTVRPRASQTAASLHRIET